MERLLAEALAVLAWLGEHGILHVLGVFALAAAAFVVMGVIAWFVSARVSRSAAHFSCFVLLEIGVLVIAGLVAERGGWWWLSVPIMGVAWGLAVKLNDDAFVPRSSRADDDPRAMESDRTRHET